MAHFPACALIAAVLALSTPELRAGIMRVTDTDAGGMPAAAAHPGHAGSGAAANKGAGANGPFSLIIADAGTAAPPELAPGLLQALLAILGSAGLDQLLAADAAAAAGTGGTTASTVGLNPGNNANAAPTPVPEAGTAALMAAALGAWLILHAIIQRSRAARRARARGMAARTWSESRW